MENTYRSVFLYILALSLSAHCFAQFNQQYTQGFTGDKDYNDYIIDNDTTITSLRKTSSSDYKNDTLRKLFNYGWHESYPGVSTYITYVYRAGKYWHCVDYYYKNAQVMRDGYFLDQELTKPDGPVRYYHQNGEIAAKGRYKNGIKAGEWLHYSTSGIATDSFFYKNNVPVGLGYIVNNKDSIFTEVDTVGDGTGYVSMRNSEGQSLYIGKLAKGMSKDSVWICYDRRDKVWYTQQYEKGKQIDETCYDSNGNVMNECITKMPEYRKNIQAIQKYLANHIIFPKDLRLKVPEAMVIAEFTIGEDGNIGNIKILQSVQENFDAAVVSALKDMPKWKPGINHNRPVKVYYKVPVTFRNQ